jgi:antibiotic biosynthesis monooxygenase (ABM) superfamily enzyme
MITFTRTLTALPGKTFEVIAYIKETQALVKKVVGLESTIYAVSGGAVGEFVSVLRFDSFAHFEEVVLKLLASPEYQAIVKKGEGLVAPGARDQLLRSI